MWDRVSITKGIEQSLNTIFAAILTGGIDKSNPNNLDLLSRKELVAKICRARFIADFPFNIFYNSYAIMYEIIVNLQVQVFTEEQLISIIDTNRDLILDSPYINKADYANINGNTVASDDDIVNAVTFTIIDLLRELSNRYVNEEEFKSSCITYITWYKNAFAEFTALNMSAIMSDVGFECRKPGKRVRTYHGLEDMSEYYNENMRIIKSLSNESRINSYTLNSKWLESELQSEHKQDANSMFTIGIPEIDNTMGELRRGNMLGIMGPPKGGKTRFANYLVQRALRLGYNVCVWPLEGSTAEWESMQIASYLAQTSYSMVKSGKKDSMLRINSKDILQKKYLSYPALRKEVAAAKVAMATNPRYGRLSFIEGTAYIEDMIDVLQAHYDNENPFDVLVIDQLLNVMSHRNKSKVERISEAYMITKNFIEKGLKIPALGIMPSQLKQETVNFLRRNPDETIDVTSGAESAETIRTPDEIIGLFSSKEERDNNIMNIYSVASRHSNSFQDFQSKCYLGSCFFTSQNDDID